MGKALIQGCSPYNHGTVNAQYRKVIIFQGLRENAKTHFAGWGGGVGSKDTITHVFARFAYDYRSPRRNEREKSGGPIREVSDKKDCLSWLRGVENGHRRQAKQTAVRKEKQTLISRNYIVA